MAGPRNKSIPPISDIAGMLTLFGIGIYMLCISWQKWADVNIDFGVELYIPWQLAKGKVLCRDIFQVHGPFSHYFNSWVFNIFGVSLMNLVIVNIVLTVILAYILYRIFLELTDKVTATAAAAFFLSVFAFSQYVGVANYNYVCPYSHQSTHGILLSFITIYLFMRFIKTEGSLYLFFSGISTAMTFLTKLELFLALFSAMITGILCYAVIKKYRIYKIIKTASLFFVGFFLPILFFLIYFSLHMPFVSALKATMGQYGYLFNILFEKKLMSDKFESWVLGIDNRPYNIRMMLEAAVSYLYIFMLIFFYGLLASCVKTKNLKKLAIALIVVTILASAPFYIEKTQWLNLGRALPIAAFLFTVYIFGKMLWFRRKPQITLHLVPFLVLGIFSFVLLFKMILNSHVYHYGFVLAMPATLLLVMLLLYQTPNFLGKLLGDKGFIRMLAGIFLVIIMIAHVGISKRIYGLKTFQFSFGKDAIMTWDSSRRLQGACGRRALEEIGKIMKKDETFIAFPEGALYNYLARRDNPTPYYDFKPLAFNVPEALQLESMKKNPPDYVLLVERDTSDCGKRYFGSDYAFDIYSWIKENYEIVYKIGYPLEGAGFGVSIAKQKNRQMVE